MAPKPGLVPEILLFMLLLQVDAKSRRLVRHKTKPAGRKAVQDEAWAAAEEARALHVQVMHAIGLSATSPACVFPSLQQMTVSSSSCPALCFSQSCWVKRFAADIVTV